MTVTIYYSEEAELWVDVAEEAGQPVIVTMTTFRLSRMVPVLQATGTIVDGRFLEETVEVADDPVCGVAAWVGGSLVFEGDQAHLVAVIETAGCGRVPYEVTLVKLEATRPPIEL